jgi:hypothetical protein
LLLQRAWYSGACILCSVSVHATGSAVWHTRHAYTQCCVHPTPPPPPQQAATMSLALFTNHTMCCAHPCCAMLCRFDLSIHFGLPDEPCRAAILQQYAHQLSQEDRAKLAAVSQGFSGRDLRDVCEQVRVAEQSLLPTQQSAITASLLGFGRQQQACSTSILFHG